MLLNLEDRMKPMPGIDTTDSRINLTTSSALK